MRVEILLTALHTSGNLWFLRLGIAVIRKINHLITRLDRHDLHWHLWQILCIGASVDMKLETRLHVANTSRWCGNADFLRLYFRRVFTKLVFGAGKTQSAQFKLSMKYEAQRAMLERDLPRQI